jgi:Cytochrome c554 and c-prime
LHSLRTSIRCLLLIVLAVFYGKVCPKPAAQQPNSSPVQLLTSRADRQNNIGDEACGACHSKKAESYRTTAHHLTSQLPTKESVLGSFAEGKNILKTSNPNLYFRMVSTVDGFYQTAISTFSSVVSSHSERIGLVVGSGRVGQTYLYWKANQLFQLPVSYWTDLDSWINSPGYRDGTADFSAAVIPSCLGCHVTYAASVGSPIFSHRYSPDSLVVGISCERCHGPGREHAEAIRANKSAGNIVNLTKLSRDRQLDVCAQCHGGVRTPLTAPFSYLPGEPLDKYYRPDSSKPGETVDVHGNQVALLMMSRCYQFSANMSCSTCHDVHRTQREPAAFSARCLQCHRPESCGEFHKLKEKIVTSCVDCHMPVQPSDLIVSNSNGRQTRAMVRSHWIKVP